MERQKIFVIEKEFRTHPMYKNYSASADGEIYSLFSNKILKARDNGNGYKMITIFDKNKKKKCKNYYIHRMVWECYHGLIPKGLQIDHIQQDKADNRLVNLQLLTPKENIQKSNNKKVVAICLETKEDKVFISIKLAEEKLGIDNRRICEVCPKKRKSIKSKSTDKNILLDMQISFKSNNFYKLLD